MYKCLLRSVTGVFKDMGSGAGLPGFKSQLHNFPAVGLHRLLNMSEPQFLCL